MVDRSSSIIPKSSSTVGRMADKIFLQRTVNTHEFQSFYSLLNEQFPKGYKQKNQLNLIFGKSAEIPVESRSKIVNNPVILTSTE